MKNYSIFSPSNSNVDFNITAEQLTDSFTTSSSGVKLYLRIRALDTEVDLRPGELEQGVLYEIAAFSNPTYETAVAIDSWEGSNVNFIQAYIFTPDKRPLYVTGYATQTTDVDPRNEATSGKIFFQDHEITKLNEDEVSAIRKKNIGIIFQSFYLIPNYTAVENVALTLELNKFKNPEKEAKLLLDRFGLKHRFNNLPSQLSGGEQQRVAIARSIAMKPELILADEPTGNLDTENSLMISDILFNYVKEEGSSLIMVTHDPKLANKAKRKIKIKDGKIK